MATVRKPTRFGMEAIIDIHDCNPAKFSKENLTQFFDELCTLSGMTKVGEPHFWLEDSGRPGFNGYSAIQFIITSSILIHTLDMVGSAYINFFSCKDFDAEEVVLFVAKFFESQTISYEVVDRI